jgi:hypothetical protein
MLNREQLGPGLPAFKRLLRASEKGNVLHSVQRAFLGIPGRAAQFTCAQSMVASNTMGQRSVAHCGDHHWIALGQRDTLLSAAVAMLNRVQAGVRCRPWLCVALAANYEHYTGGEKTR